MKRMLERRLRPHCGMEKFFGWDVPLYQRPQHIFTNFAKQRTLVLYEVTRFTDDVKGSKDSQKIFTLSIL